MESDLKMFDNDDLQNIPSDWKTLKELCQSNAEYFTTSNDENGLRLKASFDTSLDHLIKLPPLYYKIKKIAPLFDFDAETPGNGYRSFLKLMDKCIMRFIPICHQVYNRRNSIFFRKSYYTKEVEANSQVLVSLYTCLQHLETLYEWNKDKEQLSLFTEHSPHELLNKAENINQYCFYGRCLGFQFCNSMRYILTTILSSMASYSEIYFKNGVLIDRCKNFFIYHLDPEARAKRIVNVSQWADVKFCQSFWLLNETRFIQLFSSFIASPITVNQVISIPPEELILTSADGSEVLIPIPMSYIGKKPIHVRLLSSKRRIGMVGSGSVNEKLEEQSDSLIIHCHGGGFVAQSSRSHEIYLRKWATGLDVPILSIDYSLAPEAPYPRALEEVLYVYGWILKHGLTTLGSTLKKIILIGDSAGANLNIAMTLRLLELNVRRPDGIHMAYTPIWVEFIPSPSRLLSFTDPMLPFGFMMRCLKAYTIPDNQKFQLVKEFNMETGKHPTEEFVFNVPQDPLLSPYLASDDALAMMPPLKIISMDLDPCLDDCIMFAKKLKALGNPVSLDILTGLPHGFLNFVGISKEATDASNLCIKRIRELLNFVSL